MHPVTSTSHTIPERIMLWGENTEARKAKANQTAKDHVRPAINPLFVNNRYVMKKKQYRPLLKGMMILAVVAASTPWVRPTNSKLTTAVEGNPTISPPIRPLTFSAIYVEPATHILPTKKDKSH
jgi:hypothetical protein